MPRTYSALRRLFVNSALAGGVEIALGRDQSAYLATVLRMGTGDEVVLFNGRDGAWRARLVMAAKKAVVVTLIDQVAPQPAPADLWYGFAPLKAARLDYLVQKATEMGVSTLQPVITSFTQVRRLKPERLAANIVEAAEQCEVLNVPALGEEIHFDHLLERWPATHGDRRLIVADEGRASASPVADLQALAGRRIGLLIGPEGGFADEEREALLSAPFVTPISLGPRILRADTAAVAALAVIQAIIGDWR